MKKIIILILVFFSLFSAAKANNEVDLYIKKSSELKIHDQKKWLALIHYKRSLLHKNKSLIDTDNFFLSKNGRTNPKKELEETIRAFYHKNTIETNDRQHALCQFPARFEFLNDQLNFKNLPEVDCKRFNYFFNEINPESLTIIFPTTYMNNPASMFGHTLIRIDRKGSQKSGTSINSFIINFGANTHGETSGIIYAFKGVFGLYNGFFSAMPYYKMTNSYNNLENRDIWEYRLNYTQKEAEFYTKHMWELIFSDMKYYFFKENCSYVVLDTLSILQPEIDLMEKFIFYTAPIDTIRVLKDNGFVVEKTYRPSLQQQIKNNEQFLTGKEKKLVKSYVKNENIENGNRDIVYETAYNYLKYKKVKTTMNEDFYKKQSLKLLKNIKNTNETYEILEPTSPDNGHKIGKIGLSMGRFNDRNFLEFTLKPVYHELIDDNKGFDLSSEIGFLSANLRYYFDNDRVDLYKLDFIKIKSYTIQDSFFKPLSFSVLFGMNELYDEYKVLMLDFNGGLTLGNKNVSVYSLIGPKLNYSGHFDDDYTLGANGIIGSFVNFKYFKFILDFKINKLIQSNYNYNQLTFESNIILNKNLNLNFYYNKYFYRDFKNRDEFAMGFKIMF